MIAHPLPGNESKYTRIDHQTAKIEAGRVFIPEGPLEYEITYVGQTGTSKTYSIYIQPEFSDFLDQVSGFPNLENDEDIDLLEQA